MKNTKVYISKLVSFLRKQGAVILLESQMQNHPASTVSYLAAKPKAWIKANGDAIEIMNQGKIESFQADPWEALQEFRKIQKDWIFGYLGYDLKNHIEKLTSQNPPLINAPDLFFMVPELLVEISDSGKVVLLKGELPEVDLTPLNNHKPKVELADHISEENYLNVVNQIKKDIYEGEYYEINLSHPLEFVLEGDTWDLYESMKANGPVPFGGYLEFDGMAVCCSSPERFLARKGDRVWSQPIKGTASRNKKNNAESDISKLRHSEKERAENLMIVDLVRNDLGRVAIRNSVQVKDLFEIQTFETVHQMVSTVECKVEENMDSIEVIKACFPMGSMTGAPKIAAMQAIEAYENYKRGIYSGALGYIKPDGDFDFNVVIRTALVEGKKLIYPVGGAITSDSDPRAEWRETLVKARAITNIFEFQIF